MTQCQRFILLGLSFDSQVPRRFWKNTCATLVLRVAETADAYSRNIALLPVSQGFSILTPPFIYTPKPLSASRAIPYWNLFPASHPKRQQTQSSRVLPSDQRAQALSAN
jgi:hypothetical protein